MRYLEIILKLLFLAGSVYFIATRDLLAPQFSVYLAVSVLLGVLLMFNKRSSYGSWGMSKRDYVIRRIEGALLVAFVIVMTIYTR